jgi:nicotinate-nucleotide adenylyltransferase
MVSPQNPLKQNRQLLDDNQRFRLVQLALKDEPRLRPCDYEFHLPKPSYTWNTLQALKKDFPMHRFTLLIGGDNWQLFDKWYRYEDLLREYPIVVYPRQDANPGDMQTASPNVTFVKVPLINISSTMIRERLRLGKNVRGLVPGPVASVIEQEHLYD